MFSSILEIGLAIGKVILDDKLTDHTKDSLDEVLDKLDDILNN